MKITETSATIANRNEIVPVILACANAYQLARMIDTSWTSGRKFDNRAWTGACQVPSSHCRPPFAGPVQRDAWPILSSIKGGGSVKIKLKNEFENSIET